MNKPKTHITERMNKKEIVNYFVKLGVKKALANRTINNMVQNEYLNDYINLNNTSYVIVREPQKRKKYYVMFRPGQTVILI